MEYVETESSDELWATPRTNENATDCGNAAYALWCDGRTPQGAAAKIAGYRIVCREGRRILDYRLCWSYVAADIIRSRLAWGNQYTIEHWHEPTRRWRNGQRPE
jgi:hypothetical protein